MRSRNPRGRTEPDHPLKNVYARQGDNPRRDVTDLRRSARVSGCLRIRGRRNIVHGSDSPESAKREIKLFFNDYELQKFDQADEAWIFEK